MTFKVLYPGAVSRLRRPFPSDRYFFVTVRLRKARAPLHGVVATETAFLSLGPCCVNALCLAAFGAFLSVQT